MVKMGIMENIIRVDGNSKAVRLGIKLKDFETRLYPTLDIRSTLSTFVKINLRTLVKNTVNCQHSQLVRNVSDYSKKTFEKLLKNETNTLPKSLVSSVKKKLLKEKIISMFVEEI